jgi:hypothetical protein
MKLTLKYPITVDGNEIAAVTVRRPTGADMVTIGDSAAALAEYYASLAPAVAAAQAYAAAVEKGETPPTADIPPIKAPGSAQYRAMVEVAGALTGIGDNAGKLDTTDLTAIVMKVISLGE